MISILIPTKNAGSYIDKCLSIIFSQSIDEIFEVIVIDSGSTDSTLSVSKKYNVNLFKISPDEFNHSRTRNLLASKAKGDILVFLVQDAIPLNNTWLKELVRPLKDNFNISAVYSRQIPQEKTNPVDAYFWHTAFPPFRIEKSIKYIRDYDTMIHWDNFIFFSNVSAAYRKEIWEVYKFDEKLNYGEDQEIAKRMLLDGYTVVYNPESIVRHSHSESNRQVFIRNIQIARAFREISNTKARLITLPISAMITAKIFYSDMKKLENNRPFYWTFKIISRVFLTGIGRFVGYQYKKLPAFMKSRLNFNS